MTFDIPLFKVLMSSHAAPSVAGVLASGHIAQGPLVDLFESSLAREWKCPAKNVVTVNSGTSALHLAYHLAGIKPGDTVIVTPMTCSATITPLVHMGAHIVWADVDRVTGNIDPMSVKRLLERIELGRIPSRTHRPACVVAVDWAGTPANYEVLRHIVPSSIPIIEDAAHAFGAEKLIAGEGWVPIAAAQHHYPENIYTCFSFQAIKHLTTGDGGALVVPEFAGHLGVERARKLRWFGLDRTSSKDFRSEQTIDEAGYKFHMNDIAAAIGVANLPDAIEAVHKHFANAERLQAALHDQESHGVRVPPLAMGSSYWIFTILVDDRPSFVEHMTARGIQVSQVHRRNDVHPAFNCEHDIGLYGLGEFSARQVSIPCGWWLEPTHLDRIIDGVRTWAHGHRQ